MWYILTLLFGVISSDAFNKHDFKKLPGNHSFKKISITYDKDVGKVRLVALEKDGQIFQLNDEKIEWETLNCKAGSISIGGGSIWANCDDGVYRMPLAENTLSFVTQRSERLYKNDTIVAGENGEAWLAGHNRSIWLYTKKRWQQIPGQAFSLSVGADGVTARLCDNVIYVWEPYYRGWNRVYDHALSSKIPRPLLAQVSVGNAKHVALRDSLGNVWLNNGGKIEDAKTTWSKLGVCNAVDVDISSDGSCVILTDAGDVLLKSA